MDREVIDLLQTIHRRGLVVHWLHKQPFPFYKTPPEEMPQADFLRVMNATNVRLEKRTFVENGVRYTIARTVELPGGMFETRHYVKYNDDPEQFTGTVSISNQGREGDVSTTEPLGEWVVYRELTNKYLNTTKLPNDPDNEEIAGLTIEYTLTDEAIALLNRK